MTATWLRYAVAIACALLVVWLRLVLQPLLTLGAPYQLLYPIVMALALLLGTGPAVAASVVGIVATEVWLVNLSGEWRFNWLGLSRGGLVLFAAFFVGLLGERLRMARALAAREAAHAREREREASAQAADLRRVLGELRQAETAGRETERLLRAISDTSADAIFAKDRQGRMLFANPAVLALIGKPLEQVIGKTDLEFLDDPVIAREMMERDRSVMESGQAIEVEETVPRAGGERRLWLSRKMPFRDENGRIIGLLGISHDITARKRAEESARESQQLLRSTMDNFPTVIAFKDREGRFLDVNPPVEAALRLPKAQIIGRTMDDFIPAGAASVLAQHDADVMESRRAMHFEEVMPLPGGTLYHLNTNFPLIDVEGRVYGTGHVSQDITQLKQSEQALRDSEERFKAFAETIPHLAFIGDASGVITFNNSRFREYFGLEPERNRVADWRRLSLVPREEVRRTLREWSEGIRAGEPFTIECRLRRYDGEFRWHLTRVAPVRGADGWLSMWVGTSTDVHDQRMASLALRRANEELLEADRRKNEFLAVLSHELRNPLAPIRNGIYILERAAPGGEQARRAREIIDRQAQHLTRLIEDLLDVTRIARGKVTLQRERVDVNTLARGAAEDHREQFERSGVDLRVEAEGDPLFVDGDRVRLAQVVGNLLSNAIKFTPRGGRTELSVAAEGPDQAVLRVRDTGAGMSVKTLERLFEPFMQAEQTLDRSRGGLGLGLALVKGLVEMHGGSVRAYSEGPGRGSEFEVRLPLQAPATPRLAIVTPRGAAGRRYRILVIEDNIDAAASLEEALELAGHEVRLAHSGPEGLEGAHLFRPEVVVCDIGLPGLDGYGVARALRADPALRSSFLIALSGYAQEEDVLRSRDAGFDRHLAKPANVEQLVQLLSEAPRRAASN